MDYDGNELLVTKAVDSMQNTVTASPDYRVLMPRLMTDANGNQSAAAFDVLGLVTATALMGKAGQNFGDTLTGFSIDLTAAQIANFYNATDPRPLAAALLGNATTRFIYDVHRFYQSRIAAPSDPSQWLPVFAAGISRETHVSDLGKDQQSRLQISFSYSDGFGREILKKIQAEPGPVVEGGPLVDPRWVGNGWTIYNNKGKPVRTYEPFFSQLAAGGQQFEFGVKVGVSAIVAYDPPARVVLTLHPNQTYEKVVFDPWRQFSWDANDNVLQSDPSADPDVGDYFKRLPSASYSPTWYLQRIGGTLGKWEQDAAAKAAVHARTPAGAYFDPLGRPFLTIADNGTLGKYLSRVELDAQNNQRSITDELGRKAVLHDFDMLSNHVHQSSMEAGESWTLADVTGKTIRTWDIRGHNFRNTYDPLRRPLDSFVLGAIAALSDPRTTAGEILYDQVEYGEGQPGDQALNLRTRIFRHHDSSGLVTNRVTNPATGDTVAYDFKGNLLAASRQFVADQKSLTNWSGAAPPLLADSFLIRTAYDALNRTVASTEPDGSVISPAYNDASLLESVSVSLRGAAPISFITNIDYNAKGQRQLLEYGNSTGCSYRYDPLTFRLLNVTTTRSGFPANQQTVQNLSYTYDPMGNITHIQDDADIQNTIYFRNKRVEPSADYTYDALYRLIAATGREQLGLSGGAPVAPFATSYNDVPRVHLPHPGDGSAMGTYLEQYQYDAAGNFLNLVHRGNDPANPGWTRSYAYNEPSQLEPTRFSNRLSNSAISGNNPLSELYSYDLLGNMASMPQLQAMQWDFRNQLFMSQRQAVNAGDEDGNLRQGQRTYYTYDATGQRVRKTTESAAGLKLSERLYLGLYELYREFDGKGTVTLERQTLHVMDDQKRVALVETKTVDTGAPPAPPSTTTRYQFDNHLSTACLELDESAAVITYEEYYPFGSTSYQAGRTSAEVSLKRYRYTGKERDEETGFYYHGARYYIPWLCRWSAPDPVGIVSQHNLYLYGKNNPIGYVDPQGLQEKKYPPEEDPLDAGAPPPPPQVNQRGEDATWYKTEAERKENHDVLVAGGAAPQELASKGYVASAGGDKEMKFVKQEVKQGIKAGAYDVLLTAYLPLKLVNPEAYGRLQAGRPKTQSLLAEDFAGATSFVITSLLMEGAGGLASKAFQLRMPVVGETYTNTVSGTVRSFQGQITRTATAEEAAMFRRSVSNRQELGSITNAEGTYYLEGKRLEIDVAKQVPFDFQVSSVSDFVHTHPTSKVALPSIADVRSFKGISYRLTNPAEFKIIGEKWPFTRRELMNQGHFDMAIEPVTTVIPSSSVQNGLEYPPYQLNLPKVRPR